MVSFLTIRLICVIICPSGSSSVTWMLEVMMKAFYPAPVAAISAAHAFNAFFHAGNLGAADQHFLGDIEYRLQELVIIHA